MLNNFKKYFINVFFIFASFVYTNILALNEEIPNLNEETPNLNQEIPNYEEIAKDILTKHDFKDITTIGQGTEKIVFSGTKIENDEKKEMACSYFIPVKDPERRFLRELNLLQKLKHPNIIKYLGYIYDKPNKIYIIFTMRAENSLDYFLYHYYKELNIKHKLQISLGAIAAINMLHHNNLVHQDIKPDNFLYSCNKKIDFINIWLTDFTFTKNEEISEFFKGTIFYTPSENILIKSIDPNKQQKTYNISKAADIHSFGVTLYEIFYGKKFFKTIKKENKEEIKNMPIYENDTKKREPIIQLIANGVRPKLDDSVVQYPIINEIIEKCWNPDPDKRPNALDIFNALKKLYIEITDI
ncbi:protein kinase [Candidatus Dependentiae bacterium]|nr:protein kinase [Candidatus Dependentiae bacterium]MBU4387194.1 protein kinase [Candidatus Dependentiae bacterium]MCG2756174.1 protein kinase [Candidatus Dependentiae bacterium]